MVLVESMSTKTRQNWSLHGCHINMRKLFRWNWTVLCNKNNFITEQNKTSIERFHLLSSQPYWSSKQWNGGHVGALSQACGSYWLFSYVDACFGIIASHVVKTLYIRKLSLLVRRCPGFFFFSQSGHIKRLVRFTLFFLYIWPGGGNSFPV